ncbi:MAG: ribbon-helix-helix protein, CopG family [Candidatus Brocadiia bacterium]
MPVGENRKRVFVTLLHDTLARLEAAAELTGRTKSELVEAALQGSEEIGELFRNPATQETAWQLQREFFLGLVADEHGEDVAEELRRIARENEPAAELSFEVQVRLARRRLRGDEA